MSSDPKKVQDINKLPPSSNVAKLRGFLNMMNYLSRFIKGFSMIREPPIRFTKNGIVWVWTINQDAAFNSLEEALLEDTCAAYFDINKTTAKIVITIIMPLAIGSILTQVGHAIASPSLSDVESLHSQTEREALGIVWSYEHFDHYLQGCPQFTNISDHEPLLAI